MPPGAYGAGADGEAPNALEGEARLPSSPTGSIAAGVGAAVASAIIGSTANTGADGCAAPEDGNGNGGRPGLRFGDSGSCSAGTPGSEL